MKNILFGIGFVIAIIGAILLFNEVNKATKGIIPDFIIAIISAFILIFGISLIIISLNKPRRRR